MATMREQCRVTTRRFREGANWRHAKDVDSMQTCFVLGTTILAVVGLISDSRRAFLEIPKMFDGFLNVVEIFII